LRALRVLGSVTLIAAEDTRLTRRLLARHGLTTPLTSFHEHTPSERRAAIVARLATDDVALVTDAGTPGVSDPGAALVADAAAAGYEVVAVPGPSALAAAVSVSGLPGAVVTFLGFLPRRRAERAQVLRAAGRPDTLIVAFESPHRLAAALDDLADALPDRRLVICRELTKVHEQVWRGSTTEAPADWGGQAVKGEITLVIGPPDAPPVDATWDDDRIRTRLAELRSDGVGAKEAARLVAGEAGRPSREVYRLWTHDASSPPNP
jgi:16S rRNA (cytidine1402-2'-O)-methyltransferase